MTRHEADRVHAASGIAFTFAGHLVWGNPKLAEQFPDRSQYHIPTHTNNSRDLERLDLLHSG